LENNELLPFFISSQLFYLLACREGIGLRSDEIGRADPPALPAAITRTSKMHGRRGGCSYNLANLSL
jgi:hypothetical protein